MFVQFSWLVREVRVILHQIGLSQREMSGRQKKSETSVCTSMTIFLSRKHRCWLDALKEVYPSVSLQKESSLVLPKEYYNKERNRYSGTGLLKDLTKLRKGNVVLGLMNEVIYKANELSPTYGIFGVSPVGAYVAVISSTRPSGKQHSNDHLVKLMMHELGHSFGLNHCSNQHCFMVDAEHGNKFSQTPSFCK